MVASPTPTLAKIKNEASLADARSMVALAICDLCSFLNVGKNMNDKQIARTADMIIERFWYFKVEELKFCFNRAMRTEKIFDRIDGNIILQWLEDYDVERTNVAADISRERDAEWLQSSSDGLSWSEYILELKHKRDNGDKEATQRLDDIQHMRNLPRFGRASKEKDIAYKQWYYNEYLKNKYNEC